MSQRLFTYLGRTPDTTGPFALNSSGDFYPDSAAYPPPPQQNLYDEGDAAV